MEEQVYDYIVLGTGFKEAILGGLLACQKMKVLCLDRNEYYGGDSASLNIDQFRRILQPVGKEMNYGLNRDWNIDLIPKFIMADGKLVKLFIATGVEKSLRFQIVDGSFVYKGGKVDKVPVTTKDALMTGLVGMFEKNSLRRFLSSAIDYKNNIDSPSYKEWKNYTARQLMNSFSLKPETQTFIGHAMALEPSDDYLDKPCIRLLEKMELYYNSLMKYKDQQSPYYYVTYGLGDIPQGFSRLCAIYGGTFILNKPIDEIIFEDGKAVGVRSGSEVARCTRGIIGDPSYFLDIKGKLKKTGVIVRAIALLNHPISCVSVKSANIIIPGAEVGRKNDIYICFVSDEHSVCPKGWYVALVSTFSETDDPNKEVEVGLNLLGEPALLSVKEYPVYESQIDGSIDGIYCQSTLDPTTHFETTVEDALNEFKKIHGSEFDLSPPKEPR